MDSLCWIVIGITLLVCVMSFIGCIVLTFRCLREEKDNNSEPNT